MCLTGGAAEAETVWSGETGKHKRSGLFSSRNSSSQVLTECKPWLSLVLFKAQGLTAHMSVFPSVWLWSRKTMMLCWVRYSDLRRSWLKSDTTCRALWDAGASAGSWTYSQRRQVTNNNKWFHGKCKTLMTRVRLFPPRYQPRSQLEYRRSYKPSSLETVGQESFLSLCFTGCRSATSAHLTCRPRWPHLRWPSWKTCPCSLNTIAPQPSVRLNHRPRPFFTLLVELSSTPLLLKAWQKR